MAALVGTNGVVTIVNTTDTFTVQGSPNATLFQPQAASLYASAATHLILVDADGVVILEAGVAALTSKEWDNHFFAGLRPFKTPIHATTLTAGGRLRLYM